MLRNKEIGICAEVTLLQIIIIQLVYSVSIDNFLVIVFLKMTFYIINKMLIRFLRLDPQNIFIHYSTTVVHGIMALFICFQSF